MFTSVVPIPTVGHLAVSSYLIRGEEPTVIDTGITPEVPQFDVALRELIDPNEIRWIFVTHADRDHVGALGRLLTEAPNATVVTSLVTFGLMSVGSEPIPPERAFLVHDGSTRDIGDRTLRAVRPPTFDNPGTLAFFDPKQNILFSADCFGAPFTTPEAALADDVAAIPDDELAPGQLLVGERRQPVGPLRRGGPVRRQPQPLRAGSAGQGARDASPADSRRPRSARQDADEVPSSTPYVTADQAALEAFMAAMAPQ
jgi:glyoxylase-like metal-dependent hydrolase (beta-lactamase superfamily II)